MSSLIAKNIQIGADTTATNNFTIYQPATPNGTLLIGNGNTGITSSLVTLTSAGNVGIGTSSPTAPLTLITQTSDTAIGFNLRAYASGADGARTVNSRYTSSTDSNWASSVYHAWAHLWNTNGSERMRLDSSGNLGLGVTPSAWSQGKAFEVGAAGEGLWGNGLGDIWMINGAYFNGGWKYSGTTKATAYRQGGGTTDGSHSWHTAPSGTAGNTATFTQAMTLDASGNLLVGKTTSGGYRVEVSNNGLTPVYVNRASNTGSLIDFANGAGILGNITTNSFSIAYNTTSDYRLKENVQPLSGAISRVAALKPCIYTWKSAPNETSEGFIAHELAEVFPQAVTGEKDAVNEDGSIKPQSIDTSFLIATLTAAIQEQQALIQTLQADVAALKAAA